MSGRRPMRDVGPAMRQAVDRANAASLSAGELRVFNTVLALVASWSRLSDWVYVANVAESALVSDRWARSSLAKMAQLGILHWEPRRGRGTKSRLGFPPAGELGCLRRTKSGTEKRQSAGVKTGSAGVPETSETGPRPKASPCTNRAVGTTQPEVDVRAREDATDTDAFLAALPLFAPSDYARKAGAYSQEPGS